MLLMNQIIGVYVPPYQYAPARKFKIGYPDDIQNSMFLSLMKKAYMGDIGGRLQKLVFL